MEPTIGRIVHYKLSAEDVVQINRRRTNGVSIAERLRHSPPEESFAPTAWPRGAQAHIGNEAEKGQIFPMMIVRTWGGSSVNGQVFLDGNDVLWTTSVGEGDGPRQWRWPEVR